jgi:hypothetical protein
VHVRAAPGVADQLLHFFRTRDDEAEVAFGVMEGLLHAVAALCSIVRAKLSGDPVPISLMVQDTGVGVGGGSGGGGAPGPLPRVPLLAVFRGSAGVGGDGVPGGAGAAVPPEVSSRVSVVDRTALVAALNAAVTNVVQLRLQVTEAVATSLGNDCAMQ